MPGAAALLAAPRSRKAEAVKQVRAQVERKRRLLAGQLFDRLTALSLWLYLPLSIWLVSGWIGLALHWQAEIDAAGLAEWLTLNPQRVRQVL